MANAPLTFQTPCDLCGAYDAYPLPHCEDYTNGQSIQICAQCGFVHVKNRRSAQEIADSWSNEIYQHGSPDVIGYTAALPSIKARQIYVADTIGNQVGSAGRTLCDIGGGEGQFLDIVRNPPYDAKVFAIEPSGSNCAILEDMGIECFHGTIEAYVDAGAGGDRKFDIVTIMWTLENCQSCVTMLEAANRILKDDGKIVVATGSRILVPFKKPLHMYLGTNPVDTHAFRFSANTLKGLLAKTGFNTTFVNRHIDTDYLLLIGEKAPAGVKVSWQGDDPAAVVDFFDRWHRETQQFYPAI